MYCQEQKGLIIHGYGIMTSHAHLIIRSVEGKLNGTIRDFTKFTSKELVKAIKAIPGSRLEWLPRKSEFAAGRTKSGVLPFKGRCVSSYGTEYK